MVQYCLHFSSTVPSFLSSPVERFNHSLLENDDGVVDLHPIVSLLIVACLRTERRPIVLHHEVQQLSAFNSIFEFFFLSFQKLILVH